MQREETPTMATGLGRIAAKARCEPKLRFTSLAHHITKERVWENLCEIPTDSAPGVDGQTVPEAKESFEVWIEAMLQSVHEKRPLGVPCVADRALQRSAAQVLSAIYEQDFLSCSFGGRPGRGAHQALASLHEVISGRKVEWVLEADLKNFFGSLSHEWMLRFVEHRIGDPRLINLIRRWLKASVLEDGEVHANEEGTPQGSSISVMLSNVYLHYALDLWFERVVKPRLRGEAYLVRYIDDFVLCFQYRADALRVQKALCQRLSKFGLTLESTKTKLVEFGRFAQRHASKRGRKRPETIYFLGFTLYCTRNRKGNFRVGLRTEKSRLRRALMRLQDQMRRMRHLSIREQTDCLNQMLRGHYAYYGIAGNIRALQRVHRAVERYWRKTGVGKGRSGGSNSSRSRSGFRCCDQSCISLTRSCKLSPRCEATSDERSAGNLHATFCGSRGAGDRPRPPGGTGQLVSLPRSPTTWVRALVSPEMEISR